MRTRHVLCCQSLMTMLLEGDHEFTVAIDMTVPLIIIDNAAIEVMIEDNESMFYETVDTPLLVQRQMVLIINGN